jgi:hypothetical protein
MITHNDSCLTDIITNDDDEHSQEYVPRRPPMTANESLVTEEKEEEQTTEAENKNAKTVSPPKPPVKQSTYKQLKLDQFLKVVQPKEAVDTYVDDESDSSHGSLPQTETKTDDNDEAHLQLRRITRDTRLHSTSQLNIDPIPRENDETSNEPDGTYSRLTYRLSQ